MLTRRTSQQEIRSRASSILPPFLRGGALIVLVTVVAYLPAVRGDFVWDDNRYVSDNPALRDWSGLLRIWLVPGATIQYYPLTFTTFWIEYHLWGLNPSGYHLVNIALQSLNAVLLWVALRRLDVPGAWLAAAVFAVHPVHVESVAWITERKNVLCGALYISAALAYLRFAGIGSPERHPGRYRSGYGAALTFYVLALLSKTVACTFPAVLLLVLAWKRRRLTRADIVPLVPFFVLGAVMALVTAWLERTHVGAVGEPWTLGPMERCLVAGRVTWFYLLKLIWPMPITFVYPRWSINAGIWWQYLYVAGVLAVLAVLWAVRARLGKGPVTAAAYFVVNLVPAMGFINVYYMHYSYVADHFQYLASIGPIAALVALLARVAGFQPAPLPRAGTSPRTTLGAAVSGVLLVVLGALTWRQAGAYRSLETLWRDTLSKNPEAWMAHLNLANVLEEQGRRAEAMAHYQEALRQQPGDADVHYNLARALVDRGQIDEAIAHYMKAADLNPRAAMAFNNLGNISVDRGRFDEALDWYQKAIEADRSLPHGFYNAARLLVQHGQYEQAIRYGAEAAALDPHNAEIRTLLGHALIRVNRQDEAIGHLREALRLDPVLPAAHANLGLALLQIGRATQAVEHFEKALLAMPNDAVLRYYFGLALGQAGQPAKGLEQLLAAWQLRNDAPDILNALAWVLSTSGMDRPPRCPDPVELAEKACALTLHEQPVLLDTLAAAYADAGRFADAVRTAAKAIERARSLGQTVLADRLAQRLASYQAGRPHRELAAFTIGETGPGRQPRPVP